MAEQMQSRKTVPGPASSAAAGEVQGGWGMLDEHLLILIAPRLQKLYRWNLGSARLVCRQWAAKLPQGCTSLKARGEAPAGWEHLFCGLEELTWAPVWPYTASIGQCWLPKLRSLRLGRFTYEDLRMLRDLPSLSSLALSIPNITKEGLKELGNISNLTYLDLSDCDSITLEGLKELKQISALASLNLSCCDSITGEWLKELQYISNLTSLSLVNYRISDAELGYLARISGLTSLDLGGADSGLGFPSDVTDEGLKELKNMPNLTSLSLESGELITDEGLKHLMDNAALTSLNLDGCHDITDEGLKLLGHMSKLTSLNLTDSKVTDAGLKGLGHMSALTSLGLSFCGEITDAGLEELGQLSNLTLLRFTGCDGITDAGLKCLAHLSCLTSLTCCGSITDEGIKELGHMSALTSLELGGPGITNEGLKDLGHMSSALTSLYLGFSKEITDEGLKELGYIPNLTCLGLFFCHNIKGSGLKHLPGLTSLDLTGSSGITAEDLKEAVHQMSSLGYLSVRGCEQFIP